MFSLFKTIKYWISWISLFQGFLWAYEVVFEGVPEELLPVLEGVSKLQQHGQAEPLSRFQLQTRAEADLIAIQEALQSYAYYAAKVDVRIEEEEIIRFLVVPGDMYRIQEIRVWDRMHDQELALDLVELASGEPATAEQVLCFERQLLSTLHQQGFAKAVILHRELLVDPETKGAYLHVVVQMGEKYRFGPLRIQGRERTQASFFEEKVPWRWGDPYDPKLIQQAQEKLELSGLFRSVRVAPASEGEEGDLLPIDLILAEAKQRSIGFGLNYASSLGAGLTAEWEDRNISGNGQRLGLRADLWQSLQEINLSYKIPEFYLPEQTLHWQMDYHHESIKAYTESTLAFSATLERRWSRRLTLSYGGMYQFLRSSRSEKNGTFDLLKTPLKCIWSDADNLLDPTKGAYIQLKLVPSLQFCHPTFAYVTQTVTASSYFPLSSNRRHILALKVQLGSILGAGEHTIPTPERFFAGSESALRGYHYETVSPFDPEEDKPIGGRSLWTNSIELRNRVGEDFGWVVFYDFGNVYKGSWPEFGNRILQSTGLGVRYHTPIGPLRLDLAVPLNRRKDIDSMFEVYFSIGQSF